MVKHERAARVFLSIVFECLDISRRNTSSSCLYGISNEPRRNRLFWFADLNGTSDQAYRN